MNESTKELDRLEQRRKKIDSQIREKKKKLAAKKRAAQEKQWQDLGRKVEAEAKRNPQLNAIVQTLLSDTIRQDETTGERMPENEQKTL